MNGALDVAAPPHPLVRVTPFTPRLSGLGFFVSGQVIGTLVREDEDSGWVEVRGQVGSIIFQVPMSAIEVIE